MYTDDTPYEDGEDDETPEQKTLADDDAAADLAESLGITLDEAKKRLGL